MTTTLDQILKLDVPVIVRVGGPSALPAKRFAPMTIAACPNSSKLNKMLKLLFYSNAPRPGARIEVVAPSMHK